MNSKPRLQFIGVPVVTRIIKVDNYQGLDELDKKFKWGFGRGGEPPADAALMMSPSDYRKFYNDLTLVKEIE